MEPDPFDELRRGLHVGREDEDGRWRPDWGRVAVGAGAVAVLALGVVLIAAGRPAPPGPSDPLDPAVIEPPTPAELSAPPTTPARVWPDEPVQIVGTEVRTDGHRWQVGSPGDVVAIGDWNCDGEPTPAVLRPADARLYVFDRWATTDAPLTASPGPTVPPAAESIEAAGCGRATIRTTGGETVEIAIQL